MVISGRFEISKNYLFFNIHAFLHEVIMLKSNVWIAILSISMAIFLLMPSALGEDVNHRTGSESINGNQYWYFPMSLPQGGVIKYTINGDNRMNVYLLDERNMQNYMNGVNFQYMEDGSILNARIASVQITISNSSGGDYYIVVESSNSGAVNFTYDITYGKDVELSLGDFFTGFGGMICIAALLMLIVWFLVIVWVYRDAKKRGKSGALWAIIVLFLGILGLIIWLVVRPKTTEQAYVPPPPPPQ